MSCRERGANERAERDCRQSYFPSKVIVTVTPRAAAAAVVGQSDALCKATSSLAVAYFHASTHSEVHEQSIDNATERQVTHHQMILGFTNRERSINVIWGKISRLSGTHPL